MKVSDVWKRASEAGLPEKSNDVITSKLNDMAKGKFSRIEKFELAVINVKTKDMQQMAAETMQIVNRDYNGDAKAALDFLQTVNNSNLAHLDFSQMAQNGSADRLIALQKSDPDAFQKVLQGNYKDANELNTALGAPAQTAAAAPQLKAPRPAMA